MERYEEAIPKFVFLFSPESLPERPTRPHDFRSSRRRAEMTFNDSRQRQPSTIASKSDGGTAVQIETLSGTSGDVSAASSLGGIK
jgi:hypothetical protein